MAFVHRVINPRLCILVISSIRSDSRGEKMLLHVNYCYSGCNLALNKTATESSTIVHRMNPVPENAVDGNT